MSKRAAKTGRRRQAGTPTDPEPARKVQMLLHELHVHAEEITAQNETLIRTQAELERARDRYADLYDFAPIGYMALNADGVILDINLAGTALLGHDRRFLTGLPLVNLLAAADREKFRELFAALQRNPRLGSKAIDVEVRSPSLRRIQLHLRAQTLRAGINEVFAAMLDVTHQRQSEAERHATAERDQHRTTELQREVETRQIAEERIKGLMERLVAVQEQERRRLALNLHDQLGQRLTALRLTMDTFRDSAADTPEQQHRFERMEQIVSQMDRDVDNLAWELRPPALDEVGLEAALRELLRQWSASQRLATDLHVSLPGDERLPAEVETQLYRIAQEALNNVGKHAAASHVSLLLERRGSEVAMIVEDDGRGFEIEEIRKDASRGMGLMGMRERAATLGGDVQVEARPGSGTTVFVRLPLRDGANTAD